MDAATNNMAGKIAEGIATEAVTVHTVTNTMRPCADAQCAVFGIWKRASGIGGFVLTAGSTPVSNLGSSCKP